MLVNPPATVGVMVESNTVEGLPAGPLDAGVNSAMNLKLRIGSVAMDENRWILEVVIYRLLTPL